MLSGRDIIIISSIEWDFNWQGHQDESLFGLQDGYGGGLTYTDKGTADSGAIDAAAGTITVKVSLAKLNAALPSDHTPLGPGSVLAGLRGSAFIGVRGNNGRSDSTRGGTQFIINSSPTAHLTANPTSGVVPLAVNLDGSASSDPDAGDALSYTFNFGDGSAAVTQNSPTVSHTYNNVGSYTASLTVKDSSGWESSPATATITANAPPPPVAVCYEDDDAHIAYSGGWHLVSAGKASGGHFRLHNGKDATHFASLTFSVGTAQTGALTYTYAKSTKGGSAEVFIDGISRGVINYKGTNGGMRDPEFKSNGVAYSVKYTALAPGQHTFELKNLADAVYVDSMSGKLDVVFTTSHRAGTDEQQLEFDQRRATIVQQLLFAGKCDRNLGAG